jgi:hypothetical protein
MRPFLYMGEAEAYRVPQAPPPTITPGSFIVCPFAITQTWSAAQQSFQSSLYQVAWEQARAVVQPSLLERDLLGVWN